jgi:hypothetical protein
VSLNQRIVRSKRFELTNNNINNDQTSVRRALVYLIWSSLESDARNLRYLFSNFHIKSFFGV